MHSFQIFYNRITKNIHLRLTSQKTDIPKIIAPIDLIKTCQRILLFFSLSLSHTYTHNFDAVVSHLIHPGPRGSLKNPQATRNFSRKSLQSLARWSANSTQLSNHFSQPISRRNCCFIYSGTRFVTFPPDYRSPPRCLNT